MGFGILRPWFFRVMSHAGHNLTNDKASSDPFGFSHPIHRERLNMLATGLRISLVTQNESGNSTRVVQAILRIRVHKNQIPHTQNSIAPFLHISFRVQAKRVSFSASHQKIHTFTFKFQRHTSIQWIKYLLLIDTWSHDRRLCFLPHHSSDNEYAMNLMYSKTLYHHQSPCHWWFQITWMLRIYR
jgi:hypothetical protein